jgi:hypothetical protein
MLGFSVVNSASEIKCTGTWEDAVKFNSKGKIINERGEYVSKTYAGPKYQLVSKKERQFSYSERLGRIFLGAVTVTCSLGLALFSKSVRKLFIRKKEHIRFGMQIDPNFPVTKPSTQKPEDLPSVATAHPVENARPHVTTSLCPEKSFPVPSATEVDQRLVEEFKERLYLLFIYDDTTQQIAAKLSKIIPENMSPNDVVNHIFENCHRSDITRLLDATLFIHPTFTLSSYDKIRRTIAEDKERLLTNSSLLTMLQEHGLHDQEDKVASCYDLAYRVNHPNLYRLAQTVPPPGDYTLNFLWVNLNPQDRVQDIAINIFKEGLDPSENAECLKNPATLHSFENAEQSLGKKEKATWEKIKNSFTYRLSKWADVNPNTQINLWYDSALVTQKAQQNTFAMMRAISQSRGVNLQLRDIRHIPTIEGEIENSLHPGTHVFYRVDILKALIADHMISSPQETATYCVVSDIDVKPMAPQQLFDHRTLGYLSSSGYVFNKVGLGGDFENSFFIFNREKKDLQRIHFKTIIQKTAATITSLRRYPKGANFRPDFILGSQFVFYRYSQFRTEMNEEEYKDTLPRKVVTCPSSQFNLGGCFSKSDYQSETFRFIDDSNVPYTRFGRNYLRYGEYDEEQIDALKTWKAEPLAL